MSQVSLGRPEFVPGTPPGHPDRQIPLCDFSLSVFFFSTEGCSENTPELSESSKNGLFSLRGETGKSFLLTAGLYLRDRPGVPASRGF